MTYATGRTYFDADSHLMELPGWLEQHADPGIRDRIRPLALGGAGALADKAIADAEARRGDAAAAAAIEEQLMAAKGWNGLGAFDPTERSRALDLLGFDCQLVFSTFAPTQFVDRDPELLFGGTTAHNRAMVAFCADDPRLLPVGYVPWGPPEQTAAAADEAIDLGCAAILLPTLPPRDGISPSHPDHDGLWRTLAERDVPFMVHVGGGGSPIRRVFHNNGKAVTDFLGGGENIRSKDFMGLHHSPEVFLSALVLDGVFERFPNLRGGCIELGAMWVVPWLQRLDIAQQTFARSEPDIALSGPASASARDHLWFTPFPTEPVGWMIEQAGADLFLFSSDYPHPEGGRDPLGRFEASMQGVDDDARDRFFARNFLDLMGSSMPRELTPTQA
jgi:predicted TIM-barrel fold metal-dependent hydrolase